MANWLQSSFDWMLGRNQEEKAIKKSVRDLADVIKSDYSLYEQNIIIKQVKETLISDRKAEIESHIQSIASLEESLEDLLS